MAIADIARFFADKKTPEKPLESSNEVTGNVGYVIKAETLPPKAAQLLGGNVGNAGNAGNVKNNSNEKGFVSILAKYGLTEAQIKIGLSRWQQPFDENDLHEIKLGITTLEQVNDYLSLWISQNKDMRLELKRGGTV